MHADPHERYHLGDECIHGFDDGLCAICFPPKEPEPALKAPPAPRSTRARAESSPRRKQVAPTLRPHEPAPPVDARALRIYHATHLDNLARILGAGALVADAAGANPAVDLSAPDARAYRRQAQIGDATVADYVPFALTTDAHFWEAVRSGTADVRIDPAAIERRPNEYVILVSSVAGAHGAREGVPGTIVVTDQDAAADGATAATSWGDAERMLQRLNREGEEARLAAAEFLVRESLPLERLALIAVADERVRDRVRQALAAGGAKTRIAVYPPWFQPGGGER